MSNEIEIRSDIAGTLLKFVVAPGTAVAAGDEILVMESMKMEISVQAPAAGVLQGFLFDEGATVDEDIVIARLIAN